MRPAAQLALFGSGSFLLVGLLTGVWKYVHIRATADGAATAPTYVDIAHRASLLYSFAALVLFELAAVAPFSEPVTVAAVALPQVFFAGAVASYVVHGVLRDTDNQFARPHVLGDRELDPRVVTGAMIALVVAEVGGVGLLLTGFLVRYGP